HLISGGFYFSAWLIKVGCFVGHSSILLYFCRVMKNRQTDLTQGPILGHLFRLALPTIGASFMQMTYSLTDMIWLGRVGEDAVAAVGVAGFYVWFGFSLLLITRVGAEVGVSQALGRKEPSTALRFVRHALFWAMVISA